MSIGGDIVEALAPEVITQLKTDALNELNQLYVTFISNAKALKAHPQMQQMALQTFDTAYLWLKEAVLNQAPPENTTTVSPEAPTTPAS
jgi:hypothetical protein